MKKKPKLSDFGLLQHYTWICHKFWYVYHQCILHVNIYNHNVIINWLNDKLSISLTIVIHINKFDHNCLYILKYVINMHILSMLTNYPLKPMPSSFYGHFFPFVYVFYFEMSYMKLMTPYVHKVQPQGGALWLLLTTIALCRFNTKLAHSQCKQEKKNIKKKKRLKSSILRNTWYYFRIPEDYIS